MLAEAGVERPDADDDGPDIGTPDEKIGAVIDVAEFASTKRAALEAHASQTAGSFFLTMPEHLFDEIFSTEWFVRVIDPTGAEGIEDDLFSGIR
jgi:LmbE family N-acetylglucosaminyl deacetylase